MPTLIPNTNIVTADGNKVIVGDFGNIVAASFLLVVLAAATEVGDTLDVYIQSSIDKNTYDDFIHFTQVLGNGGTKQYIAYWNALMAPEAEIAAPADATMSVGVKQGPIGSTLRVKWKVVDAGTANASFTFALAANFVRGR